MSRIRMVPDNPGEDPLCVLPVPKKMRLGVEPPAHFNPAKLPPRIEALIYAVCNGVDETLFPNGRRPIPPGSPLSVAQAALAIGVAKSYATRWSQTPLFRERLRVSIRARREAEEPENIAAAIEIRDNHGDGTIDRDRIRLAAIDRLRVKEPAAAVNVELQQHTLINSGQEPKTIAAGYVIRTSTESEPEQKSNE